MRADFHTHTLISDGELLPSELARRAMILGHDAIAITDHVDFTNVERAVSEVVKAVDLCEDYLQVIPGVEITHVPPSKIDRLVKRAKNLGAKWVVVHGETVNEPVMAGTNSVAVHNMDVDVLAHPGLISEEDVQTAVDNDVIIEITGRKGHNVTNGHVANLSMLLGAKMLVNSDGHGPQDLMNHERAMTVALGAGLTVDFARKAVEDLPSEIIRRF
ncbi:MAG: histidinol phosphate phosphatase domain-containing protein [Candidatus Methanomethylophilaceae archaeon]